MKKQKNIKIVRITGFIFSIVVTCVIVWGYDRRESVKYLT